MIEELDSDLYTADYTLRLMAQIDAGQILQHHYKVYDVTQMELAKAIYDKTGILIDHRNICINDQNNARVVLYRVSHKDLSDLEIQVSFEVL